MGSKKNNSRSAQRELGLEFAKAYADGLSKSEAYRVSHPGADKLSSGEVSKAADKVFGKKYVQDEIKRLKDISKETEVITRKNLLDNVKELLDVAKENSFVSYIDEGGKEAIALNTKAADIYIKAIDRAAKMIGADEPEKVDTTVRVILGDDLKKYAN